MAVLTPSALLRIRAGKFLPWLARVLGLFLLTLAPLQSTRAQPPISGEYQVKAVFLFNFAQFVEWPARAFSKSDAPLIIGLLGDDPFGAYLDELVKGEKVGARALVIHRFKRAEDLGECHILFISRSLASELEKIIPRLRAQSVLTVSDIDTFNRDGGMVRLATESGKIRLKIRIESAKSAGLTISSKILRPGTIVDGSGAP